MRHETSYGVDHHADWEAVEICHGTMFRSQRTFLLERMVSNVYVWRAKDNPVWDVRVYRDGVEVGKLPSVCELQVRVLLLMSREEAVQCVMRMFQDTQAGTSFKE